MQKHYDALRIEGEMQKLWEEEGIYKYDPESKRKTYSIDTPPPTVSGKLHIGHLFSYTQAEMIARFRRMQGYNIFYPFGFDDNDLPTERLVEKEFGIRARDIPRSEMTHKCTEVARSYEEAFKALWQSMGFSVDWDLQYETNNSMTARMSQKLFLELARKGHAYTKESPVLWCTECQTSIAQAELATIEKETQFNYIPFKVGEESLTVATTRPELLCSVVCLFIHPEDMRYKQYIGKEARIPLYDETIPILADEGVDKEKGTGIVMCATFGDWTDAGWYEKHQLPYKKAILAYGKIADDIPHIGGLKVEKARETIIQVLEEKGLLLKSEKLSHAVAVHERCGKSVEIIPSKQWYIDILTHKERYLQAADEINWYPESMKNRYKAWVSNLKWDWCISRQRYFGIPIPIWYCESCGKNILPKDTELPINPLEHTPKEACTCGNCTFIPEASVMDTWATSSITPQINAKWQEEDWREELQIPMGLRTQAHEIIRTWAFYTIVRSLYHTGKLPWKDIMISGFVLAKKGEKMSKSKNNGKLEPKVLISKHSADAIRYWAANARLGADTFFEEEELMGSKRFMNKLWNATKFSLMHLQDIEATWLQEANKPDLLPADRWLLERVKETTQKATQLLNQYEIGLARHEIDDLFWKDFCDDYLEIVKDRLYKPELHGTEARKAGQYTLYHVLLSLLKLYAIYIPHQTEFIYQTFFRQYEKATSIHQIKWELAKEVDKELLSFGMELKRVVGEIRKYKSENNLSMKSEIEYFTIVTQETNRLFFEEEITDIKACGHIQCLEIIRGTSH